MTTLETDWLASRPVFYNDQTGRISYNVNDVIDFANLEFDADGLANYLRFGFSAFGQTPVKHVRFLDPCSRVESQGGKIVLSSTTDPAEQYVGRTSTEDDVLDLLRERVKTWESRADGEIVIPTSGGCDSRLLNTLVHDRSRVRSFTYGVSERQFDSSEVVKASRLASNLGTQWRHIPLTHFHDYMSEWNAVFGPSTHAHGMFQMEFYDRVRSHVGCGKPLLSGIFGDALAGKVDFWEVKEPSALVNVAYTQDLNGDPAMSLLGQSTAGLEEAFEKNRHRLNDPYFQTLFLIRIKMVLISYLLTVPRHFEFQPWSPFLDPDIALRMLTLPRARRTNRVWQREYFRKNGCYFEADSRSSRQNSLDMRMLAENPPTPLDTSLLREIINSDYCEAVNRELFDRARPWVRALSRSIGLSRSLPIRAYNRVMRPLVRATDQKTRVWYNHYMVLKPIECLLRQRNQTAVPAA